MVSFWVSLTLLPTAREGNVFTSVCHSVHRGKVRQADPPPGQSPPGQRPPLWKEHGTRQEVNHPPHLLLTSSGHCSSGYTSYRNAFLLKLKSVLSSVGTVVLHRFSGIEDLPQGHSTRVVGAGGDSGLRVDSCSV